MFDIMIKLKQTGRTSRMLQEASLKASENKTKNIIVIMLSSSQINSIAYRSDIKPQLNLRYKTFEDVKDKFDFYNLILIDDKEAIIFIDHAVIEKYFYKHITHLHKFDKYLNLEENNV